MYSNINIAQGMETFALSFLHCFHRMNAATVKTLLNIPLLAAALLTTVQNRAMC